MNIAQRLKQLNVSVESAEVVVPEEPVQYAPVDVAESIIELNQADAATDQTMEDLGSVMTAEDKLSTIATGLEAMVAGKGMSQTEYRFTQHAVQAAIRGLGLSHVKPSIESFAGSKNRIQVATASLEGVSDNLKALATWVKEMISAFIEKAKEFVSRLFDVSARLKSKAEAIKAKAENAEGRQNGKVKIAANVASNLSLGESYVGDLVAASGRLVTLVEAEVNKLSPLQIDALESLMRLAKEKPVNEGDDAPVEPIIASVAKGYKSLPGTNWQQDGDKLVSDELLGGYGYFVFLTTGATSLSRIYPVLDQETEVPSLNGSKVATLCDNIIELAGVLGKAKETLNERMAQAKSINSTPGGLQVGDSDYYVKRARFLMRTQLFLLRGSLQQLSKFSVNAANSMLTVCNQSLEAYEPVGAQKALPA